MTKGRSRKRPRAQPSSNEHQIQVFSESTQDSQWLQPDSYYSPSQLPTPNTRHTGNPPVRRLSRTLLIPKVGK